MRTSTLEAYTEMFNTTRPESCPSWKFADKLFFSWDCPQAHLWAQRSRRSAKTPLVLYIPIQKGEIPMGIISWIVLGLIAGAIARLILPGRQGGGWLGALVTGILGALLGGWIASAIFNIDVNNSFFELSTWIFAILGGVIVAFIWQWISSRSGNRA